MPLFSKRKCHGTDFKARLEHKLYLARENPEPEFDLSDCDLKNVPHGIFSLCKVFRKGSLHLQNNQLSTLSGGGDIKDLSLLEVLDLSYNIFTRVPSDVQFLINLRVLNMKHNHLKDLPKAIGYLVKLQTLDVSDNCLESVTSALGDLKLLELLDLRGNAKLKSLPSTLCQAPNLQEIRVDGTSLVHPPPKVVSQGTDAILQFFAEEIGLDRSALREMTEPVSPSSDTSKTYTDSTNFHEIKQQDMLALEHDLVEHQRREFELQDAMKQSRVRLLDDLMVHQCKLESDILRVHHNHELERERLIQKLLLDESSSDIIISQLLALRGGTAEDPARLRLMLQQELLEEEELIDIRQREYESLRRKDVLNAMEAMLEEEYRTEEKLREYEEGRAVVTRTLLSQEVDNDQQLATLLTNQGKSQVELIGRIQHDEELQRAAVGALLERGDARSWGLVQQVCLVEQQLAALTSAEMQRKRLELLEQVSDLCEKRVALSALLLDLLAQQTERRQQLLRTMEEIDRRRWIHGADDMDRNDFWLYEYQRLLDSRPGAMVEMERSIDPLLAQYLILGGVLHCIPLLSQSLLSVDSLTSFSDSSLKEQGINDALDRKAVLEAISHYLEERSHSEIKLQQIVPTAPVPEESTRGTASSPVNINPEVTITTECVVCMELQCEVIFVPCGHMCCCIKCAEVLESCPMCRADIQQKIRAILP